MPSIWEVVAAAWGAEDRAIKAFRTGEGVRWEDQDGRLHCGVVAFFRNRYCRPEQPVRKRLMA